ncbi:MAG: hypothetical protein U0136_11265 [Bdellovibrionota bacterium]
MAEGKQTYRGKDPSSRWNDSPEDKARYAALAGPKQEPTIIDRLIAGQLSPEQLGTQIFDRAYGKLARFYSIPEKYRRCRLAWKPLDFDLLSVEQLDELALNAPPDILDPCEAQLQAIFLFQMFIAGDQLVCSNGDPFQAKIGANFHGPAGTAKTHIMCAFGNLCMMALEQRLRHYREQIADFVKRQYALLLKATQSSSDPNDNGNRYVLSAEGGEITEQQSPAAIFSRNLDELETKLARLEHQPTDLMFIGFDPLCELVRDEEQRKIAFAALQKAKLLFIDDVHPKNDPDRAMIVQQIIERRYEQGRRGTIVTTNLTPEDLAGKDEQIAKRLLSRCGEMMLTIDFAKARDWRAKVNSRRVKIVEEELKRRVAAARPKREPASSTSESSSDSQ